MHLPGDELISLKKSGLKRVISAAQTDNGSFHINNIIKLADSDKDDVFVFLHELGHQKAISLKAAEWADISSVYQRELAVYKSRSSASEQRINAHIIDNTEHYLRARHGAVEEIIADVNALIKYPNKHPDLAERVLTLQEFFPETIAKVVKYL